MNCLRLGHVDRRSGLFAHRARPERVVTSEPDVLPDRRTLVAEQAFTTGLIPPTSF